MKIYFIVIALLLLGSSCSSQIKLVQKDNNQFQEKYNESQLVAMARSIAETGDLAKVLADNPGRYILSYRFVDSGDDICGTHECLEIYYSIHGPSEPPPSPQYAASRRVIPLAETRVDLTAKTVLRTVVYDEP